MAQETMITTMYARSDETTSWQIQRTHTSDSARSMYTLCARAEGTTKKRAENNGLLQADDRRATQTNSRYALCAQSKGPQRQTRTRLSTTYVPRKAESVAEA